MSQPDEPRKGVSAFWTTLPGVLTGIAGLLTAIVAIVGLFGLADRSSGGGGNEDVTHAEWVARADQICSQSVERVRQLPPLESSNFLIVVPAIAREIRDLAERLRALDAPEEDQVAISRLTSLLDQQRNEINAAIVAYTEGNTSAGDQRVRRGDSIEERSDAAARSLGINACAQRVTPAGAFSF
jgi:hypothetical protein